jgi:hypothetical protein
MKNFIVNNITNEYQSMIDNLPLCITDDDIIFLFITYLTTILKNIAIDNLCDPKKLQEKKPPQ